MSKTRRARRKPKSQPNRAAGISQTSKSSFLARPVVIACIAAIILAGIPFVLGKYIEFNSPGAFDSGGYVYSAQRVLQGAVIGVDERPSAQLGTLLVNMLGVRLFGFSETGPEIMQMLFQAGAFVALFVIMRKLFGNVAAVLGVFIASYYLNAPLIAKYGNVKEQYMIAVMILGVCSYIYRQTGGRWWWSLIAGALLVWAPLFKPTGVSAAAAVGLFAVAQPVFGHRSVKDSAADVGLLLGGAAAALAPACLWLIIWHEGNNLPYGWLWRMLVPREGAALGDYVSESHAASEFAEQASRVFAYYRLLILPIALAMTAIGVRLWRLGRGLFKAEGFKKYAIDRFVLLLAVWWILDMAFIWISPRSYEEYYLPLNGSAAMLGGYAVAVYLKNYRKTVTKKPIYLGIGAVSAVLLIAMSFPIFFGITHSPHSGVEYADGRRRGYVQRFEEARQYAQGLLRYPWEQAGDYIRQRSDEDDTIYVWGWVPGIYVRAQRLSSTNRAFTSEMHVMNPQRLGEYIAERLDDFRAEKPAFFVDTQKRHFPWDRPPLQLWPATPEGPLPNNPAIVMQYEQEYRQMLAEQVGEDEAARFDAMKPLRDFVMNNYEPAQAFGPNIVFRLKQ